MTVQRIMFTGTHGIGKSATAQNVNKVLRDHLYMPSFAGPVAKRMGFDLNQPHTPEQLIKYQNEVLTTFIESYKVTSRVSTIYDRSPNDLAAYAAMGLKNHPEFRGELEDFIEKCLQATREYCDVLIYPQALFNEPLEFKYNRPVAYEREEFDMLIKSYRYLVSDEVKLIDVPVEYQYEERTKYILERLVNVNTIRNANTN